MDRLKKKTKDVGGYWVVYVREGGFKQFTAPRLKTSDDDGMNKWSEQIDHDVCGKSVAIFRKDEASLEDCSEQVPDMIDEIEKTSIPDAATKQGFIDLVTFRLDKADYALDMFMSFKDGYVAGDFPEHCSFTKRNKGGFTLISVRKKEQ